MPPIDPNQTPPPADPPTDPPAPKYMTAEDLNGALTARFRREEQARAKEREEFRQSIAEMIAAARPGGEPTTESDSSKQSAADQEIKKANAKLDAMQKQFNAEKEAAAKEKTELLKKQERSDTLSALTAAGSHNAKGAYAVLKEDGKIRRNADGELVIALMREYGEEEVPLATGLVEWLKTDEGKHYMPPRGGGEGSGSAPRNGAPRAGGKLSKEEAKSEAQKMLTKFILGG